MNFEKSALPGITANSIIDEVIFRATDSKVSSLMKERPS